VRSVQQCAAAPPQPEGRAIRQFVQIDVRESFDLDTGYSREGWYQFLWLSGWRAWIAIRVLKALSK
jgi:hypothetical protein